MNIEIILSEQDLSDFFQDNQDHMEAYRAEAESRLNDYFDKATVSVEISRNALTDQIFIDDNIDSRYERVVIEHIMNEMVSDWEWLPE